MIDRVKCASIISRDSLTHCIFGSKERGEMRRGDRRVWWVRKFEEGEKNPSQR